jgi:hypothetical protein
LVQGLFAFIISAADTRAADAADSIDFINEDNGRSGLLGEFKKSRTRDAPTPTNISTNSEPEIEKNATCASPATARASKVLPVPGAPIRDAFRNARADFQKLFRIFQEVDNFRQFFFGFFGAGDIFKRHALFLSSGGMIRAFDWPKVKACMPAPRT